MHVQTYLAGALAVAAPLASATCGFSDQHPTHQEMTRLIKPSDPSYTRLNRRGADVSTIDVPVHLHGSVTTSANSSFLTLDQLHAQYTVLRDAFAPHGINLIQGAITRDVGDDIGLLNLDLDDQGSLQGPGNDAIGEYWNRTRTGGYDELHIYFYEDAAPYNPFGICTFPDVAGPITPYAYDACHIEAAALPGKNSLEGNKLGKTAVHEAGHWFGLLHVFAGPDGNGCLGDGDGVDDTPAQKQEASGCSVPAADTCPEKPGVDTGRNHMDYTSDACRTEFTPGQEARMHAMFNLLRKGYSAPQDQ